MLSPHFHTKGSRRPASRIPLIRRQSSNLIRVYGNVKRQTALHEAFPSHGISVAWDCAAWDFVGEARGLAFVATRV